MGGLADTVALAKILGAHTRHGAYGQVIQPGLGPVTEFPTGQPLSEHTHLAAVFGQTGSIPRPRT